MPVILIEFLQYLVTLAPVIAQVGQEVVSIIQGLDPAAPTVTVPQEQAIRAVMDAAVDKAVAGAGPAGTS